MEKDCVANFYVKLSGNATAIPLTECELRDMIRIFRRFKRSQASDILFRFKYGTAKEKKVALGWFDPVKYGFDPLPCFTNPTISKLLCFTDREFDILAKELQIQYQAYDPTFLNIESIRGIPRECKKELEVLQGKLADSPLLYFIAVKTCFKVQKNPAVSQWALELFSSNCIYQYEGLKNLGFNFNCRLLLKPFSLEIGTLLLSMHQVYINSQKLLTSQDELALPLVNILKLLIEQIRKNVFLKCSHYSDKIDLFESAVVKFIKKSEYVRSNSSNFNTFAIYSKKLEALGNSILHLLYAENNYSKVFSHKHDGFLYVAATDPKLFRNMHDVEIALCDARKTYNSAYHDFQKFFFENFEDRW